MEKTPCIFAWKQYYNHASVLVHVTDRVIYRPRTRNSRGPLHVDQEGMSRQSSYCIHHALTESLGCRRPQAPREKPKGQGLEIQTHSHRIKNSQIEQILQDCWCIAANMEVRERYRQHYGRIRDKRIREEKVAEDIRGRRKTSMDPAHYRMDGVAWA